MGTHIYYPTSKYKGVLIVNLHIYYTFTKKFSKVKKGKKKSAIVYIERNAQKGFYFVMMVNIYIYKLARLC